ncbi:hypothetical protein F6R98_00540 [Candidatus Methylospira mobilis]|uniref:Uncharacterized protein n=1 Tax=Candidatus Methylospira mobilis TaxID=1808979 RepID=A0A5Q0BCQ0_9GAMM|nr:hypothetical protein [Candidatus Methylospira mobilis]QFY41289.1 hypothetical protein F6R98_00540 [Candidatus Methylospira mobilis]WNV05489.1 hypothetical protein RP726_03505 [Candidatus Methylospira mobilis]
MNDKISTITSTEMTAHPATQPALNNQLTAHPYPSDTARCNNSSWYLPLTPGDLLQRLILLSSLQVPCMIYTPKAETPPDACKIHSITDAESTGFPWLNNDIASSLAHGDTYSIWVVGTSAEDRDGDSVVIEIYNCARALVARLFSLPDSRTQAIWQDVFGNPTLAAA